MWCIKDNEHVIDYETNEVRKLNDVLKETNLVLGYMRLPAPSGHKYSKYVRYNYGTWNGLKEFTAPYSRMDYMFFRHIKRMEHVLGERDIRNEYSYIGNGMVEALWAEDDNPYLTLLEWAKSNWTSGSLEVVMPMAEKDGNVKIYFEEDTGRYLAKLLMLVKKEHNVLRFVS